jgi:hypothetical protein
MARTDADKCSRHIADTFVMAGHHFQGLSHQSRALTADAGTSVIASASEAIHRAANPKMDCFVASAPRNDGADIIALAA